jgi:hypothetical protein
LLNIYIFCTPFSLFCTFFLFTSFFFHTFSTFLLNKYLSTESRVGNNPMHTCIGIIFSRKPSHRAKSYPPIDAKRLRSHTCKSTLYTRTHNTFLQKNDATTSHCGLQRSCNQQPSRLQQPAQRIKSTTATPAVISFNLF